MSCYLPQPPRVWSRVQNSCSLITSDNSGIVRDPYTGEFVQTFVLAERISMLNKGNILQYKANSSNLTKNQRYSKIAKGQWVNRNTTWATQSLQGYTNPNTTSLKRAGNVVNIAIDPITGTIIGPTLASPSCPETIIPIYEGLPPNQGDGDIKEPIIPPPIEPKPGSNVFPDIIVEIPVSPLVIQDGGNLICSIQENICTGATKSSISQQLCNPTTDSDVPGQIQNLCWNDGTQTWYPRQRYVMSNSTDKWPINYKFLVSAVKPPSPILTASANNCLVTINWTDKNNIINCNCLKVTGYNIYINNAIYQKVSADINSITFVGELGIYNIYITSTNDGIESIPSNIINVYQTDNIIILENSKIKYTKFPNGIIIETTITPEFNGGGQGMAKLIVCKSFHINMLLTAGGGGGACGNNGSSKDNAVGSGGGGAGGSISYLSNFMPPINENIILYVGSGGGGRNIGNGGNGASGGQKGYETQIITSMGQVLCSPGTQGLGVGSTSKGGGDGGSATGSIGLGYGGGGGGGALNTNASNLPGIGGTGFGGGVNGVAGTQGNSSNPGNGGNSGLTSYSIPNYKQVYLGGGGSGGYLNNGGLAGDGNGGTGQTSNYSGENATNYGGGGGGGSINATSNKNNNTGGNGANGSIIIWW